MRLSDLQNKLSDTYKPADDTFFLAEYVSKEKGKSALEIGSGSGYLTEILQKNFESVVATDIDFAALAGQDKTKNRICCDGASAVSERFDLIVCNLPYLPSENITDKTTDGGPEGLQVPSLIIESASRCVRTGGKMLLLTSSLANYQRLIKKMQSLCFSAKILAKRKLFFEELIILEATR